MSAREGPRERRERPGASLDARPHHTAHQIRTAPTYRTNRRQCVDTLRRRRLASQRSVPLGCGCREPWWYEPPGERGYEQAALHLLDRGLLPAVNLKGLRVMHRQGGASRNAAQHIAQAWELAAWPTLMT